MMKKTSFAGMLAAIAVALGSMAPAVSADGPPKRIVSFNLCADQLLLALADPAQIAGLSPYAVNPLLSVMTERAAAFPRLDWDAESVVNLAPDLVLGGPSHRPIHAMMRGVKLSRWESSSVIRSAARRWHARSNKPKCVSPRWR
jgi:iron complex transport system substrate-binding protein